jgi:hypothetical protein
MQVRFLPGTPPNIIQGLASALKTQGFLPLLCEVSSWLIEWGMIQGKSRYPDYRRPAGEGE